jgi:hypothetical protein
MKNSIIALALAFSSTVIAAPAPAPENDVCGPDTNCERVTINGFTTYKFKEGHEPGTENFAKRFSGLSKRAGKIETKVEVGDTKIDWGCDEHLTPTLDLLWDLCGEDNSSCDQGSSKAREIEWTGGFPPTDEEIKVTAEGKYYDKEERDHLIHAIKKTVRSDTIETVDRDWQGKTVGSPVPIQGTCQMNLFTNFIGVSRFEDGNLRSFIDAKIEMEKDGEGKSFPIINVTPFFTSFPYLAATFPFLSFQETRMLTIFVKELVVRLKLLNRRLVPLSTTLLVLSLALLVWRLAVKCPFHGLRMAPNDSDWVMRNVLVVLAVTYSVFGFGIFLPVLRLRVWWLLDFGEML